MPARLLSVHSALGLALLAACTNGISVETLCADFDELDGEVIRLDLPSGAQQTTVCTGVACDCCNVCEDEYHVTCVDTGRRIRLRGTPELDATQIVSPPVIGGGDPYFATNLGCIGHECSTRQCSPAEASELRAVTGRVVVSGAQLEVTSVCTPDGCTTPLPATAPPEM